MSHTTNTPDDKDLNELTFALWTPRMTAKNNDGTSGKSDFNRKKLAGMVIFSFGFAAIVTGLTGKKLMKRFMVDPSKVQTGIAVGTTPPVQMQGSGFANNSRGTKKVLKSWYNDFQALKSGTEPKVGGMKTDLKRAFFDNRRLREEVLLDMERERMKQIKGKQKEGEGSLATDLLSDLGVGLERRPNVKADEEEDEFNGATYALKAFSIATAIVLVVASTSYVLLLKKLDLWDMESLSLYLSEEFSPTFSIRVRAMTNRLIPASLCTSLAEQASLDAEDEAAFHGFLENEGVSGLSDWIKELDKSGQEHVRDRAERWKAVKAERDRRIREREDRERLRRLGQ